MGDVQMQRNGMNSWAQNQGGVDNVLLKHIVQFENQWDKIK
jgi:cytolysin (calcineurin-like family phosphatase)